MLNDFDQFFSYWEDEVIPKLEVTGLDKNQKNLVLSNYNLYWKWIKLSPNSRDLDLEVQTHKRKLDAKLELAFEIAFSNYRKNNRSRSTKFVESTARLIESIESVTKQFKKTE